jgi:hypothetical protein
MMISNQKVSQPEVLDTFHRTEQLAGVFFSGFQGSSHTSASQSQSNVEQCIAFINSYNNNPSNPLLTHKAKVEMISMAPMDEPVIRASNHVNDASSVVDNPLPLENIGLSNQNSLQPSPTTAPLLSASSASKNDPEQASMEVSTPAMPLYSTGNVQLNIDKDRNTLSIPVEKIPERHLEKNYYHLKEG